MYERILVPVDGSPTGAAGLTEAVALAKQNAVALAAFLLGTLAAVLRGRRKAA